MSLNRFGIPFGQDPSEDAQDDLEISHASGIDIFHIERDTVGK